ncbi:MAG: hypothetical protein LRY27_02795 [Chitinophagales bacterium]|nr:hypothetical protein [Chitinophagales bacterium]
MNNVGLISNPIQHIQYEGKDYIYFNNDKGQFKALNRKGESRFNKDINVCTEAFTFLNGAWYAGSNTNVYKIDLKGNVSITSMFQGAISQFLVLDAKEQNKMLYAFTSQNQFMLKSADGKEVASFKTNENISAMEAVKIGEKNWFVLQSGMQIYLIDDKGKGYPNFPIQSKTMAGVYPLIKGKEPVLVYQDTEGNIKVLEINWTINGSLPCFSKY